GRRRPPGGPAERPAVARDAGRSGASRRQDRRHRHPLRRAAPARRDPLMRVTVLTGGATAERAVAFAGAAQIVTALRGRGHEIQVADTVAGLLSPRDEQRVLSAQVGPEPPATAELDDTERHLLSTALAELSAVRQADVLLPCSPAGCDERGVL